MKRIRLKARVALHPCVFRDTCHGSFEWCQTHSYTETCVGMLQHQCECLRKNWVEAEQEKKKLEKQVECLREQFFRIQKLHRESEQEKVKLQHDVDALKEHFREVHAQPNGTLYTLEEIAEAICEYQGGCSTECPGYDYTCRKGEHAGTLQWLREVMSE